MSNVEKHLDRLEVRYRDDPPGHVISEEARSIVLHNHNAPCHHAGKLADYDVRELGREVSYEPRLKRLCDSCLWPKGAQVAFERPVEGVRG